MSMEEPEPEDALTVDELIARLEAIRARWGGDLPCVMCDFEPVVRAIVHHGGGIKEEVRRLLAGEEEVEGEPCVILTDRYQDDGEEEGQAGQDRLDEPELPDLPPW